MKKGSKKYLRKEVWLFMTEKGFNTIPSEIPIGVVNNLIAEFYEMKKVKNNGVLDDVKECSHPFNKVVSGDEGDFCTECKKYLKTNRL